MLHSHSQGWGRGHRGLLLALAPAVGAAAPLPVGSEGTGVSLSVLHSCQPEGWHCHPEPWQGPDRCPWCQPCLSKRCCSTPGVPDSLLKLAELWGRNIPPIWNIPAQGSSSSINTTNSQGSSLGKAEERGEMHKPGAL